MKKLTALLLSVLMALGFVTSCSTNKDKEESKSRDRKNKFEDEDDYHDDDEDEDDKKDKDKDKDKDTDKKTGLDNLAAPVVYYDKNNVDASETFKDYKFKYPQVAWAEQNNLLFVSDDVLSPATEVLVDYMTGDPIDSAKPLVDTCTVQKPDVTISQSTREGYVDYYITYSHIFPFKAEYDKSEADCGLSYFYYGIELVDYYTGAVFPSVNQNGYVDSYYVSGNLSINGEEYFIECYADRSTSTTYNNKTVDGNTVTWEITQQIENTIVVTVPEDYDGLMMGVYIGEETQTYDELNEVNDGKLIDFHIFGERYDELDAKDYAFFKMFDIGNGQYLK